MAQHPTDPVTAFAELGRIKHSETSLDEVLNRVADLAQQTLPGAREVSITLVRDHRPCTAAFTGGMALRLDEWQYEQHGGPCLQAAAEKSIVSVPDTAADSRWAGWAARAGAAGAGSVLSVGLPILDNVSGALNIYGGKPEAFDADATLLAQTFAGYAAVALANAHLYHSMAGLVRDLQAAMASRAVIEQAKGIVMGERRCSGDEAFAVLTKLSQDSNRKLRDVASALVARAQEPAG